MRYALLIAWREFAENAKTKGFWFGLFLFPALIALGGTVPTLLARKTTPTRRFVLVDQTGRYAPLLRAQLAADREAQLDRALRAFARNAPYSEPFAYYLVTNAPTGTSPRLRGELDLERWKRARGGVNPGTAR
jgi:hypothetical protein